MVTVLKKRLSLHPFGPLGVSLATLDHSLLVKGLGHLWLALLAIFLNTCWLWALPWRTIHAHRLRQWYMLTMTSDVVAMYGSQSLVEF
jgi:hypothetical protein